MTERTLAFVYNADSGLFSVMADAAHKAFSPETYQCNLCKITYGLMTERKAWRAFIADLGVPTRFLHRDEFAREVSGPQPALPAVLWLEADGTATVCADAEALNQCQTLDELIALVRSRCLGAHPDGAAGE